jgi:hypothetical protein
MADALLLGGSAEYREVSRRVLATLGGTAHALLVEEQDATPRVVDAVYYLRAYARIVARPVAGGPQR